MATTTINPNPKTFTPATHYPFPTVQEQFSETQQQIAEKAKQAEQDWLNDPEAQREYQEYRESVHGVPSDEELDRMAEEHELEQLGASAGHCFAGHDRVWQAGGSL